MIPLEMRLVPVPRDLWAAFYHAVGPATMKAAYGWASPQWDKRPGEIVFMFSTAVMMGDPPVQRREVVAWAALLPHPATDEWFLSLGVWPKYQRQGIRVEIRRRMGDFAFRKPPTGLGAEALTIEIFEANRTHYQRCERESQDPTGEWLPSGAQWMPGPPFRRFTRLRPRQVAEMAPTTVPLSHGEAVPVVSQKPRPAPARPKPAGKPVGADPVRAPAAPEPAGPGPKPRQKQRRRPAARPAPAEGAPVA